uniref:Uncharacterized protein n=1 Tax=Timema douglasi TaxID=61478 RepID=A0A7R8VQG3_TIMDO|nr:unnamed protein product [Timema douglasi]
MVVNWEIIETFLSDYNQGKVLFKLNFACNPAVGIGKFEYRRGEPAFAWRKSGKPPTVHPSKIRSLISPSSAV